MRARLVLIFLCGTNSFLFFLKGDAYDGFRETLLPGRDVLQQYCLPWHRKPKTWISVGCGTARDIEYVIGHLKACGTHLFLLDLSPDLLEMARERVAKHGLEDRVRTSAY